MLTLCLKIHPKVLNLYLWISTFFVALNNFLFGTLRGALLLAMIFYFYFRSMTDIQPMTAGQLVTWFSDLPSEAKNSVATALVTVIGFFVAFMAATSSWKEQARVNLQLAVANEIEEVYGEALDLVIDLQTYVESVVDEIKEIRASGRVPNNVPVIDLFVEDMKVFEEKRQRLSKLSMRSDKLQSKYYYVLTHIPSALPILERCSDALDQITTAMWIRRPQYSLQSSILREQFVSGVNVEQWSHFADVCDKQSALIGGYLGGLKGLLHAPITRFTFASFFDTTRKRKDFEEAFTDLRANLKDRVEK